MKMAKKKKSLKKTSRKKKVKKKLKQQKLQPYKSYMGGKAITSMQDKIKELENRIKRLEKVEAMMKLMSGNF